MNPKPSSDAWHIAVYQRRAGDYGWASISGMSYSEREAKNLQDEIQASIRRHVDDVARTEVVVDEWQCSECEEWYEDYDEARKCCSDAHKGTKEEL